MSDLKVQKKLFLAFGLLVCVFGVKVRAQSLDARAPTPVRNNEIVGRIGARDLGDSRLTDHFYAFTGTPGDLVIAIETQNLNGDMDVFTAGGLRPVLKVALYAEIGSPVSKSVYLRQREDLILRIEARTPNDLEGIYHIRFSGSFEPIAGAEETDEANAASESANAPVRRGKRVSSVGARINEPPPVEVAAAPTPEPTPVATPEVVEAKTEAPAEPTPKSVSTRSRPTSRRGRGRTPTASERAAIKPVREGPVESKPVEETNKPETVAAAPEESSPAVTSRAPRKGRSAAKKTGEVAASHDTESPPSKSRDSERVKNAATDVGEAQPAAQGESKLIIELMDGTRIERPMTEIRRVTLESGQVVVVGTDGNVERIRLARVLRMSIGQ